MNIMPTAKSHTIRCPKCGYALPQQASTVYTCPVIGCNTVFDVQNLPLFHPDPERQNLVVGAVSAPGNGTSGTLSFGRNEKGEIIVVGVNGTPTTVTVPEMVNGCAVMGIGPRAFANQPQLRRVTLPDTVCTIDEEAFTGCAKLESVTFGKGLTLLDKGCFSDCPLLDAVTLPAKVNEIGRDAFARCTSLAYVELQGKVEVIRDGAFELCESLSTLRYGQRPARVAAGAFTGCYSLPQNVQDDLFSCAQ